mmetsp:Transcript_31459/g.75024  ORF Transcript_31459/g.75024 Transcript_31459/m.75024 type:complete len:229 (+) Transcript_31459:274-960(+)
MISTCNLGIELDPHAVFDVVLGKVYSLHDLDAGACDCLVLLIAHRTEKIDTSDPHPIQGIWHHCLEAGISDAGNLFGVVEVHLGPIPSLLIHSRIVDSELDDLAQASSLFPEVNHHTDTSPLGTLHSLPQSKDQVRPTAADIASEDIRADALVVNTDAHFGPFIFELSCITKSVDCEPSDSWKVGLHLGVQQPAVVGELVQRFPQLLLTQAHPFRHEGNVPGIADSTL